MDSYLKVGDQFRQTVTRFRNMDNFEAYFNSIDQDYDLEDTIFKGYIYKLDFPHFNKVNRSQYGKRYSFDKKILNVEEKSVFYQQKDIVSLYA